MTRSALEKSGLASRTDGISDRVKKIIVSPIKEIAILAAEIPDVIPFAWGIPFVDTPPHIRGALKKALDEDPLLGRYSPSMGLPVLRQALTERLQKKFGIEVNWKRELLVTAGAMEGLMDAIQCTVNPGEEVIITSPGFSSYTEQVTLAGGIPKYLPLDENNNWAMRLDLLPSLITPKTKAMIINSPSNPTGEIIDRAGLEKIAKVVARHPNLWVLSDECYDCFYYAGQKPVSFASLNSEVYQRTLTINAFSKTFSMTGWRLGYGAGPKGLIKAMNNLQDQISSNPNSIAQKAGLVAWSQAGNFPEMMRKEFKKRRELMVTKLNQIKGFKALLPDGAFYVWVDISGLTKDDQEFCRWLLEEGGVAVIPGMPFGGPGHIRLSFATSLQQIEAGINLIKKFVDKNYG